VSISSNDTATGPSIGQMISEFHLSRLLRDTPVSWIVPRWRPNTITSPDIGATARTARTLIESAFAVGQMNLSREELCLLVWHNAGRFPASALLR